MAAKKQSPEKNRSLSAFLTELQIEQEKKEKILKFVGGLTEDVVTQRTRETIEPKLRLVRGDAGQKR